ncbi:MAG: hypothetical protein ACLFQ8_00685 [Candidatus Aenigmatarchaeota archaeon]
MAFWKSDDEKKREIEEVKRQVEGEGRGETRLPEPPRPEICEEETEEAPIDEGPVPPGEESVEFEGTGEMMGEPSVRIREDGDRREEMPDITRKPPQGKDDDFAPLFVKIDKYNEVLQDLESVRSSLADLKQLFELMNEVDNIKRRGMKELREGMANLANTLVSMDEKFIRPEGSEEIISEPESGVSKTVQDLQGELRNIRDSLDRME